MGDRYARQVLFNGIGHAGQQLLQDARVAIIGCGALGSSLLETLVRAGVGTIHIADRDYVELSNLQRQQLFTERDAIEKQPKVIAAGKRMKEICSNVVLHTYLQHVDSIFIKELAQKVDIIVDATDNFETRLLINDAAYKFNIPWVYGACVGSAGVVFPFVPHQTACLRCLLPVIPTLTETCDTVGIIAPAVQITAAIQSAEVLKWLTKKKKFMRSKVYYFDCWHNSFLDVSINKIKNPNCETCSKQPTYPSLQYCAESRYSILCGRNAVQILPNDNRTFTFQDVEIVANQIQVAVKKTPYYLELVKDGHRIVFFQDGRILIHGVKNINASRKIISELFG